MATLEGHTKGVNACAVAPDGRHVVSASEDRTLKVWDLGSGRTVATLEGHTGNVSACAVTPGGQHMVSTSEDKTLKVWDLATYTCSITHRGDTPYRAVAISSNMVIAGDAAGAIWFLDLPPVARSPSQPTQPPSARRPRWWSRLWGRGGRPKEPR